LDNTTIAMLDVAVKLSAEELDLLRVERPEGAATAVAEIGEAAMESETFAESEEVASTEAETAGSMSRDDGPRSAAPETPVEKSGRPVSQVSSRGEYERQRTRDSKVATTCLGRQREKHEWWPVGTVLEGHIGLEVFTAMVVENPHVKSGRSLQITSGPFAGQICQTPTRAALEATEAYRNTNNLGRAGGVTNGWEFWKPRT
jgi:hypothetical protein